MKELIIRIYISIYKLVDKILKLFLSLIGILYIIQIDTFNFYIYYILLIWWIIYAITDFIRSYTDLYRFKDEIE